MRTSTIKWGKSLVAAVVSGSANAVLASLGIAGANAVGAQIPALDPKQLGTIAVSGAVVGLVAYLKQSPVPPDETTITTK